ncbi:MAG: Mu-like prophage major head subunit gpT family protein [Armatimonadetes bacterium]|nr:Mu-like prophage major head subunit gpT family protein [Armatimonadota bacterium]
MAITKSDIPDLLLPGLRAEFELAYRSELNNSVAEKIATVINTTQPSQKYAWLGAPPAMREFVDERSPAGMSTYALTIEDRTFESTIAVDRKAIEDDQLDFIRLRIRDLALRVAAHRHQLVVSALTGGFTTAGIDGVSFFASNHPGSPGASYGNVTSQALGSDSLGAAISAMMAVPDDQGIPLGIMPDTLVVGPSNLWLATELVESPVVVYRGNATDTAASTPYLNAFRGKLNVVVSPFISGTSKDMWFVLDTKRPIRPVVLQQRSDVPVEFAALEAGSGSESAFMRDRFYYGVRGRYNVGLGLWQAAYGGNP